MPKRKLSLDDFNSSPSSTPKKKYHTSFKHEWLTDKDFIGVIEESRDGKDFVWCMACVRNIYIYTAGGKNNKVKCQVACCTGKVSVKVPLWSTSFYMLNMIIQFKDKHSHSDTKQTLPRLYFISLNMNASFLAFSDIEDLK